MNISIVGSGYVGLVSGTCFAEMGVDVTCVDVNREKIKGVLEGKIPVSVYVKFRYDLSP